jgi:small subunit ribosomal protein S7
MPRARSVKKRTVEPDPIHQSLVVTKLISKVMWSGKRETAQKIVYEALERAAKEVGAEPLPVLNQALVNVTPRQEVRSRRVGGANYQIPRPVKAERGQALAIRWIVDAARGRAGKPMADRLAEVLKESYNNEGPAVKKKEDTHKMAEANRAFAHFRW